MKLEIKVAKTTQTAIPEMGRPEKHLYFLIIGEGENQITINVGPKTYESIQKLSKGK